MSSCLKNITIYVYESKQYVITPNEVKLTCRRRNSRLWRWWPMVSTGVDRFADDIASMIGFRPGIYWRICWKFIAPCFLLVITVVARDVPKGVWRIYMLQNCRALYIKGTAQQVRQNLVKFKPPKMKSWVLRWYGPVVGKLKLYM